RRTRQLADNRDRVSVARKLGVVPAHESVDQGRRELGIVARQVMQLRADRSPPPWTCAVETQHVTYAMIVAVDVAQQSFELRRTAKTTALPQCQYLARKVIGLMGQRGADRTLAERGHVVAVGVDHLFDTLRLTDFSNDTAGQFAEPLVDVVVLSLRELECGF